MTTIIVQTEEGQEVWSAPVADEQALLNARCDTNTDGSMLVSGLRRAVEDAFKIEHGLDSELLSEKAMRLAFGQPASGS